MLSSRTHLLMVFIAIYFRYLNFKNPSIAMAIQGFLKPNYRKYLSPKISQIIMSYYLSNDKTITPSLLNYSNR